MGMGRYRPKPPPKTNLITPQGMYKLEQELDQLWNVERPKVVKGVADAAAEGDRSENAEYIYGKKRLREIDRKVKILSDRVKKCRIVEPRTDPHDVVYFGSWFKLKDEEGNTVQYRLVGPDEFDLSLGHISIDSPVGKAVFKKKLGDEVEVKRPKGEIWYEIISVGPK